MLILVDKRAPAEARERLSDFGGLLELETEGIVYPAISGHPDIFFCQTPETLIVSPSLPKRYTDILDHHGIQYMFGNLEVTSKYPDSVHYNASVNHGYLVHRLELSDPVILQQCHTKKKIPVKQGYTRCNLLLLKQERYLTSDVGIHNKLSQAGLEGLLVNPKGILLTGFPNGFIGGTMGIHQDKILIMGSLKFLTDGRIVRNFLVQSGYDPVELYDGPLFDGGGIMTI